MKTHERFKNLPVSARESVTENMKERIYSTITLLAVLATMWQNAEHHTHAGTIASILGAVVAVWLATLIATRMSYRAVNGKPIDHKDYVQTFFTSAGLLAPAITPVLIVAFSAVTDLFTLKTALMSSMVVSLLSLFVISYIAGRRIYSSLRRLLVVCLFEMLIGVGIILLKLAIGE